MEGDAGTSQLNPTDQQDSAPSDVVVGDQPEESIDAVTPRPSRIGRGIGLAVTVALVLLAIGAGVGGYLALRANREAVALAAQESAALAAAKDCVTATQAPDTKAMIAAQTKIIECGTGAFGTQAPLYSGVILDAYKAADAEVKVADMRAAVEKHNGDGSMDVLVAVRVRISNSTEKDKEVGYRLRAQMAPVDGVYKIAKLEQVGS